MDKVRVAECIITTLARRGSGEKDSPVRPVTQVWERAENGDCFLLAESDPCAPIYDRVTRKFKEEKNGN